MIVHRLIASLCLATLFSGACFAGSVVHELDFEFSGATAPTSGTKPWLTATYDDEGSPGSVKLTLENTNLVDSEYTKEWYINLNTSLNPASLNFSYVSSVGSFSAPSIQQQTDNFKADGDGFYDILFTFAKRKRNRFGAGESITYNITGIPGLTAADFNYGSKDSGNGKSYLSAAHILAINGDDSGWIAPSGDTTTNSNSVIPEPSSVFIWLVGLGVCLGWRRRRARTARSSS